MLTTGTLGRRRHYTGAIFIKGFGDPSLSTASYQSNTLHFTTSRLEDFVTALKNAGVKKIVGKIVGDDTYFDKAPHGELLEPRRVRRLRAALGALPERRPSGQRQPA